MVNICHLYDNNIIFASQTLNNHHNKHTQAYFVAANCRCVAMVFNKQIYINNK